LQPPFQGGQIPPMGLSRVTVGPPTVLFSASMKGK